MAEAELQRLFSANKAIEPDILSELESMMRLHNLSAEDLFFKWESYCIKMDLDAGALTLANVRALKRTIQDALEQASHAPGKPERKVGATPKAGHGANGGDMYGMLDGLVPSTPGSGGKLSRAPGSGGSGLRRKMEASKLNSSPAGGMSEQLKSMSGLPPASPFSERQNPGEIVEVLNDTLPAAVPPMAPYAEPRIKLTAASDVKKMAYKPLAMKLSEASEILDDRIDDVAALVAQHHKLDESVFGSAASQGTAEIVAVGRIASDSTEGKLNAASLVLETSRRTGMGFRVPLRMDAVKSWGVFPGQIVALKGTNVTGNEFAVSEILDMPLLPNAASPAEVLRGHRNKMGGADAMMDEDGTGSEPAPLNIIYAAGPYTADDNLDFEPLHTLCSKAADTYADALVLTGPFIDIDHPLIATGDFDLPDEAIPDPDTATMSTVFKYLFAPAINRLATSNPHITIILVPSVRDVIDKHVSWPQDAIPRKELGLPKAARIVSNPMTLSFNEAVVGLSSQDVLYELRSDELSKGSTGDLMSRLCRYLVDQRHYYPIYPPTDRSRLPRTGTEEGLATGGMLDLSYVKLGEMVNVRPDVMLIPSALPPFAKVVESVVAVNPGFLSKRRGAGTYARMSLYPPKAGGEGLQAHRVFERARVEIVRI